MKEIPIKVPQGIQYISDWKEYVLPKGHCIVDKGVTGCGYTEFCLTNSENVILCSPRKLLLKNKSDQHKNDLNIFYFENKLNPGEQDFKEVKDLKERIKDHIFNCQGPFQNLPCKILVTYDSCHYVVEALKELGILGNFTFVIDEFQSIFLDSYFKSDVEIDFLEVLRDCPNVLHLSATPMLKRYLLKLSDFKDLDFYSLNWNETGYVENIKIKRRRVKSLGEECGKIIQNYLQGIFPVTLDLNRNPVESREVVFYFNSVTEILRLVKKHGLTPDNTRIVCADTPENQRKLKKLGFSLLGVPLPWEKNPTFMFCTSSVYMGVDMYSENASSYIFANPNLEHLALDISLDLPQIVGRQRNKSNPFKNDITIFYKTNSNIMTREEFDNLQFKRKELTYTLLDLYNKSTDKEKDALLIKLKDSIQVSQYSDDFVSISKNTNLPVYNPLIEVANERAWEVSQEEYQDSVNVTKSLEKQGWQVDKYLTTNEFVVQNFLDNYFYKTGIFTEKMRMYCEFRDLYNDNKDIIDNLNYKILDSKYQQYYEYYGTSRCRAVGYREKDLYNGFKNISREEELMEIIYKFFRSGDRFTKVFLKQKLQEIYDSLGIFRKAKASDLGKYFKLIKTNITDPVTKKLESGFKLGERL